jgi:hypothetical protein
MSQVLMVGNDMPYSKKVRAALTMAIAMGGASAMFAPITHTQPVEYEKTQHDFDMLKKAEEKRKRKALKRLAMLANNQRRTIR